MFPSSLSHRMRRLLNLHRFRTISFPELLVFTNGYARFSNLMTERNEDSGSEDKLRTFGQVSLPSRVPILVSKNASNSLFPVMEPTFFFPSSIAPKQDSERIVTKCTSSGSRAQKCMKTMYVIFTFRFLA